VGGVTTHVSGFSRRDTNGQWNTAWLGVYAHGLGVTDIGENGSLNTHVVDNIGGYHDYVEFEFSNSIVVTQAFLDYIYAGHSNMSVWIGTKTNPITNHNTLSDAFLTSIGPREDNNTTSTAYSRYASFNGTNRTGNVVVIAASASDPALNDGFKIHKLFFGCQGGCPFITVNPSSLPHGQKGHSYSQTLTASGGSGPYTFTKTSGSLPPGLTLSPAGVISGTPTSNGTFTFTVQATDSHGCTGSRTYSLVIGEEDDDSLTTPPLQLPSNN
jgi:hypothetical protein